MRRLSDSFYDAHALEMRTVFIVCSMQCMTLHKITVYLSMCEVMCLTAMLSNRGMTCSAYLLWCPHFLSELHKIWNIYPRINSQGQG